MHIHTRDEKSDNYIFMLHVMYIFMLHVSLTILQHEKLNCPIPSDLRFSEHGEQVSYLNHLLKLCPSNVKARGSFLVSKKMIFTKKYINRYVNIYTFFTK